MKNVLLVLMLFVAIDATAQCGVYLSAEDFIAGKLSDVGDSLSVSIAADTNRHVVIHTRDGEKEHSFDKIYGYKNKLSVYRIINSKPYVLVCRGALTAFTPYGPIEQSKSSIVYYRRLIAFGQVVVTANLLDSNPQTITDFAALYKIMEPAYLGKVKEFVKKMSSDNGGVMAIPEQVIEYYNSLQNGYVPATYNSIKVDVMR